MIQEPTPPCRCTNDTDNSGASTILLCNFVINFASTGLMLMFFLHKINKILLQQFKYAEIQQCEP